MADKKKQGLTLTDEQRGSLAEYLEMELDSGAVSRGSQLHDSGAVLSLTWNPRSKFVVAEVQGGKLYKVIIHLLQDRVFHTECECPMEVDCKHCAATIHELLERGGTEGGGKADGKKEAAVAAKKAKAPVAHLVQLAAAKLGKPLRKETQRFLERASTWWITRQATITANVLREAAGMYSFGHWGSEIRLYPKELPPKDEAEFIAWLHLTLNAEGMSGSALLSEVVDKKLQAQLNASWQRIKEIEKWRRTLGVWAGSPSAVGSLEPLEAPMLRLRLHTRAVTVDCRKPGESEFKPAKNNYLTQLMFGRSQPDTPILDMGSMLVLEASVEDMGTSARAEINIQSSRLAKALARILAVPALRAVHLIRDDDHPLRIEDTPLRWLMVEPEDVDGDYELQLLDAAGNRVPKPIVMTSGIPRYYVTSEVAYPIQVWPFNTLPETMPLRVPAKAMESSEGMGALDVLQLPLPSRLGAEVRTVKPQFLVRGWLSRAKNSTSDYLLLQATASYVNAEAPSFWSGASWLSDRSNKAESKAQPGIVRIDRSAMPYVAEWLKRLPLKLEWHLGKQVLLMRVQKAFPSEFIEWVNAKPAEAVLELDAELASLTKAAVAGTVRLDVQPAEDGMDWFDLKVDLAVEDLTLTKEEIDLLLKAKGGWVRLVGKGWKKLEFQFSDEQQKELAELGLASSEFNGETQRLHALQLAGKGGKLLPADSAEAVRRRVEEIQTRVVPDLPASITATLRPYQLSGFHFLAYLSTNRFGGILADDMGLGKTLQTLAWIAWLRETQPNPQPALVVCPKSVQDNWRSEAERFFPLLRVVVWSRSDAGDAGLKSDADLLVIHYQQLRQHEESLCARNWSVVVLDEAQAIKNPTSQTTQVACKLRAGHRLALTGTPIENRLLDLWSIFSFAMPGALGSRAHFTRHFDSKTDPLARLRLSGRVRPFLLRRTKSEVAKDLPDRIEEDLMVEIEGVQQKLYAAELKRARAQLLKAATNKQLDKLRFNMLTSLLRLRQICCHPRLVGNTDPKADSAKLNALMEQLEPIIEEGQKVLVFSQFTEMLDLIEQQIDALKCTSFKLTGQTDDRGPLVRRFNEHEGAAVFLISLKAGGFGLNLTSASYVVLYDPWWNPAVEAQAIDRTHRIGQRQTVFAYRLLVKGSIEEKIRLLQKQKGALANDILGEESFAQALTLDDFRFLLGGDDAE